MKHFNDQNRMLLDADAYVEKVASLFDRYLQQWGDEGRPQGAHNVPRRGQLRDGNAMLGGSKRTFKQLVAIPEDSNQDDDSDEQMQSKVEITSQNLEDNASIIQS